MKLLRNLHHYSQEFHQQATTAIDYCSPCTPPTDNATVTEDHRIAQMMEQLRRMEECADARGNLGYGHGQEYGYYNCGQGRGHD